MVDAPLRPPMMQEIVCNMATGAVKCNLTLQIILQECVNMLKYLYEWEHVIRPSYKHFRKIAISAVHPYILANVNYSDVNLK